MPLLNVSFNDCSCKFSNFQEANINGLNIANSYMYSTYFNNTTFNNIIFNNSDFKESEFIKSPLLDVDLSTCKLDNIRIDLVSIKGCKVNSAQGFAFLSILGIEVIEEIRSYFKEKVYTTIIPRLIRLAEAPSHGKPIIAYDPKSKGSAAYLNLAKEVIDRNGNA